MNGRRADRFSAFAALFITKRETYSYLFKNKAPGLISGLIHLKYRWGELAAVLKILPELPRPLPSLGPGGSPNQAFCSTSRECRGPPHPPAHLGARFLEFSHLCEGVSSGSAHLWLLETIPRHVSSGKGTLRIGPGNSPGRDGRGSSKSDSPLTPCPGRK